MRKQILISISYISKSSEQIRLLAFQIELGEEVVTIEFIWDYAGV